MSKILHCELCGAPYNEYHEELLVDHPDWSYTLCIHCNQVNHMVNQIYQMIHGGAEVRAKRKEEIEKSAPI